MEARSGGQVVKIKRAVATDTGIKNRKRQEANGKIVRVAEVANLASRWERRRVGGWKVVRSVVRLKIFEIEVQLCGAAVLRIRMAESCEAHPSIALSAQAGSSEARQGGFPLPWPFQA